MMASVIKNFAARISGNTSGVAVLEFALAVPIMLPLVLYGVELANLAAAHQRISQIANMTADNAARVRNRIDEVDVNDTFVGARLAGAGIQFLEHGRIMLSVVEDNTATTGNLTDNIVTWQRCKGTKTPPSTYGSEGDVLPAGIGPTGTKISATSSNPIIFTEVFYDYQPILPVFMSQLLGSPVLHYSSAYTVRDRVNQTMQNGTPLAPAATSRCTTFSST